MPIHSMTGFAREQGYDDTCSWVWEVRSVNGKGRDVRCRLPGGLESLDQAVRDKGQKRFQRGNITLNLSVSWIATEGGYRVNREVLDQLLATVADLADRIPEASPPTLDGLLALKGVIEPVDDVLNDAQREELEAALLAGLDAALDALSAMRGAEGERLETVLNDQLNAIESLTGEAAGLAATQPDAIRARLKEQVESLLADVPALSEERLAQEAGLLMTKADIREELDRLAAHVVAARELLASNVAIGRKLDFMCQELNREANTLCSKSSDVELTRIGLDLKTTIDQLREQVQNIE